MGTANSEKQIKTAVMVHGVRRVVPSMLYPCPIPCPKSADALRETMRSACAYVCKILDEPGFLAKSRGKRDAMPEQEA